MHGVGDLVTGLDGSWMVRPPERCAHGHLLRGRCIVGTTVCACQDRHLSWTCDVCQDTTYGPNWDLTATSCTGPPRSGSRTWRDIRGVLDAA
jgi:hypothetical protein